MGRIEGLGNTTRDGVDAMNEELDELFKRMDAEHESLHAGDSSEKKEISEHVQAVMADAQANLTRVVGEASGRLGAYMEKVIGGADAGLSESVERLEEMGDNLNSTIKQDGSELLQLIDVSRMNVSFVASRLDSAVEALTRRVAAIQASRDAVEAAQKGGHAKSISGADDLQKRIEADEAETKETAKLSAKLGEVMNSLKAVRALEAQKFEGTIAGLKEDRNVQNTIKSALADGLKIALAKVSEEDRRRRLAYHQTTALLNRLRRDIHILNYRIARASKPRGDKGPTGPRGTVGPQGAVGARGKQGARGPRGPPGDQGPVGKEGIIGPIGLNGPAGDRGPVGDAGEVGPSGIVGRRGPTGPRGARGAAGQTGPAGPPGRPGDDGKVGEKGRKGEQGQDGPPGEMGLKGPVGPPGAAAVMPPSKTEEEKQVTEGGGDVLEAGKQCSGMKSKVCKLHSDVCRTTTACGCIPKTCDCGDFDCVKAGGRESKK